MRKKKENSFVPIKTRVTVTHEHADLYQFLDKAGSYYRGKHLVRLAAIGLIFQNGKYPLTTIGTHPDGAIKNNQVGVPADIAPAGMEKIEPPKEVGAMQPVKAQDKIDPLPSSGSSGNTHYSIPDGAADAMSSVFADFE